MQRLVVDFATKGTVQRTFLQRKLDALRGGMHPRSSSPRNAMRIKKCCPVPQRDAKKFIWMCNTAASYTSAREKRVR